MPEIRLEFPDDASDEQLRDLRDRLNRAGELRGRVRDVQRPAAPGTMSGGILEAFLVDVVSHGAAEVLIATVGAWMHEQVRRRRARVRVEAKSGGEAIIMRPEDFEASASGQQRHVEWASRGLETTGGGGTGSGPAAATGLRTEGSRAVLIGAGSYASGQLADIPAAVRSVRGLDKLLTDRCGMAPDDVVPLADWGDAGDVKEKLEEVARAATGVLLVYYAGHGLVDADGKLHLALRRTNPGQLENTAVAFDSVFRRLAYSPAREIIVILDCCFAGSALTPDGILNRGYTVPRGIDGGYILTSVARDERAMAPPGERYTAFSGELLAYLRDGDPDGGENLTMGAAARYLKDKLQARGLPQPEPGSSGDGDQIALAGNPAYQPGPALPSTATMTASRPAPARAPTPPPGPRPKTPGPDPAPDPDASQSTMTFNRMGPPSPVPSVPFRPPTRPIAPPAPSSVPPAPDPAPDPNPAPDPGSAKPGDPGDPGGPGGPGGPGRPGGLRGLERRRGCAIGGVISVFVIVGLILAFTLPGTSKHTPPAGPTRSPTAASSPTTVVCPTGTPAGTPTLTLVGSTAFAPVAQTVAGEYMKQCPGAVIKFDAKDSASGFSELILDEQSDPAAANSMIAMFDGTDTISPGSVTGYPTGATVFAVVANSKGFHQPAVSIQQLKQIFVAGEPGVVAVGRLRGSGSREALLRGALGLPNWQSIPVTAPACPPKSGMFCTEDYTSQVLDTVNANPNEVGYAGYQEFIDKSAQYQNLDVLRINDVAPSAQSVEDRQYNFWAIEHVYTSKHPTALAGDFLAYLRQHLRSSQQDGFVGCEYVPAGPDNDCQS